MNCESIKNAPKDAGTSDEAISSSLMTIQTDDLYDNRNRDGNQNVHDADNQDGLLLYEFRQGGKSKRFMQKQYRGKYYAELREWYQVGDEWRPSKKGCTIPIDEIAPLCQALSGYSGGN